MNKRYLRLAGTLAVTGLCTAYLVWKIDLSTTLHLLAHAHVGYFLGAVAIMIGTVIPMAWRWQQLLAVRGIHDRLSWLTRAYFVAYTAGQLLPTAVGGDAVRIYETARRHPGEGGPVAGSVLLERALGGAATLALAAVGFVLALGHYDVGDREAELCRLLRGIDVHALALDAALGRASAAEYVRFGTADAQVA